MKSPRFLILPALLSVLIAALVWHLRSSPTSRQSIYDHPPHHAFLPAEPTEPLRIECLVATSIDSHDQILQTEITPCTLGRGWSIPDDWGSWSFGHRSEFTIELDSAEPHTLLARVKAYAHLPEGLDQAMTLIVNGRPVGRHGFDSGWEDVEIPIPAEALKAGLNTLSLVFDHRISPKEAGHRDDDRQFAARVQRLSLDASGKRRPSLRRARHFASVWDDHRKRFVITEPGRLVFSLEVPDNVDQIAIPMGFDTTLPPETSVTVSLIDIDGDRRIRSTVPLGRKGFNGEHRFDIRDLAGSAALTEIRVDAIPAGAHLDVGPPDIVIDNRQRQSSPSRHRNPEDPPDIVVLTLDAARPDHFSYAGYHRSTTPKIDELAKESLVFSNAWALSSYTLSSVPTMITGLSHLDHGVVGQDNVLPGEALTLAEILGSNGYRTAAFSANPNNSAAKGFDQGYEHFVEIWKERPGPNSKTTPLHSRYIAERVLDWLDTEGDDHLPLHLQVHVLPPHAPYNPPAGFDLFSDPEYDGGCTGSHASLAGMVNGDIETTPSCLENVIALYDGNLRAADHGVGLILEELRRRPRWRNTVVLITSDHGEAFMEHGRTTHGSTVFGEMLAVPFVLRLPTSHEVPDIDLGGMVTLADITPTLLGLAGLSVEGPVDGRDLLHGSPGNDRSYFVSRSSGRGSKLGLRTVRWSLMVGPRGWATLFDLADDPDESRSRIAQHPEIFAGLTTLLLERTGRPAMLDAITSDVEVTDDERELLDALGYIDE